MFVVTNRFRDAVGLINKTPTDKFPLLLVRILEKLHLKHEKIFSEEEEEHLREMLSLSSSELDTILESCSYIFERAAYNAVDGEALQSHLRAVSIVEEKASAFEQVWSEKAPAYVTKLREHSLAPRVVSGFSWDLDLHVSQNRLLRQRDPSTVFKLTLSSPESQTQEDEVLSVEMSHRDLYQFFVELEKIQEQLDALS